MKQYAFSDAEFLSAREKLLVLKAWVRFLKNGLRWEDFSDRLYKHLINHCSFHRPLRPGGILRDVLRERRRHHAVIKLSTLIA
jgi:hypothetical protein